MATWQPRHVLDRKPLRPNTTASGEIALWKTCGEISSRSITEEELDSMQAQTLAALAAGRVGRLD